MKYFLEFKEADLTHTWIVEINKEPHFKMRMPEYKFLNVAIGREYNPEKIIIKFLENYNERNLYRREVLFEKIKVISKSCRKDSVFIITLARMHAFLDNQKFVNGTFF
jgi:hypothetical protein